MFSHDIEVNPHVSLDIRKKSYPLPSKKGTDLVTANDILICISYLLFFYAIYILYVDIGYY